MSTTPIQDTVKQYILNEFLPGESGDALAADEPLISGNILDSIATLKLVTFLEETYGVQFEAHEINTDNLDSLNDIAGIVQRKSNNK